jgi:choline dehydrogenase
VGITAAKDLNAGIAAGLFSFPLLMDSRFERNHAQRNHYERVKFRRLNYHLIAEHTGTKVLFEGKKAVRFEYQPSAGGGK